MDGHGTELRHRQYPSDMGWTAYAPSASPATGFRWGELSNPRGNGIERRPYPSGPIQRYACFADTMTGSVGDDACEDYGIKWQPSIHMQREACRLVPETTDVRVERLQAISEADTGPRALTR